MEQDVGVLQLLKRGLEGLDQMGGQLADEADGVREQHLLRLVELQAASRGVQRVEQAVVGLNIAAGEEVQERAFARVGVADDGHDGHGVALAAAALDAPDLAHLLQLLVQLLYFAPYMAAVGLKLRLAGAARAYGRAAAGGCLTYQVRPHAGQAGKKVLVLRQLDLELALACARPLGEYVEYQSAAVEHTHAQLLAEHTRL